MGLNNNIKLAFKLSFQNRCIQLFVSAYKSAIFEKTISLDWDENDITAQLHYYIDNNPQRSAWKISTNVEHHLAIKNETKVKGFSAKYPRIDLRFNTFNSTNEVIYFMEAKNLRENNSALKRRYIETGIDNFISGKYNNGLLVGYLLSGEINNTIEGINKLLRKDNRESEVICKCSSNYHDQYFESVHLNPLILRHLMFDFTLS